MISILMPVFNTEPYLRQCLDSIIQQSFTAWELIAVDDFSTDGSTRILKNYSCREPRIRYMRNDSKGIIYALEKAYHSCRGDIIHRMDSDDIMPIDKLEILYKVLTQNGRGSVATGKVRYFSDEWEVKRGFRDYADWINQHIEQNTIFEEIFMECPVASPAWMMYRKDLEAIGGITDDRYPEDYDLVFRMFIHGISPFGTSQIVHLWRDWSDRASRTKNEYSDQLFFDLKLHYFLQNKYQKNRSFVLWGAGPKGKNLYRRLKQRGLSVIWVTENSNKIGHNIYGTVLLDPKEAPLQSAQVIVAVSQPEGKRNIRQKMMLSGKRINEDLFFFC